MENFSQKTVLITGCSSGIGRATALYLAERGWRVLATARRLEDIEDLHGPQVDILQLDVADEASRVAAVGAAVLKAGRIDALVNNAGFSVGGPLEVVSMEDAHRQFDTNTWGPLRLTQLVAPIMRAQGGGRIVNVTSVLGKMTVPFSGLYAASKWALEAISDNLRWELHPWNIDVIVVEPGFVKTQFGRKSKPLGAQYDKTPLYREPLEKNAAVRAPLQRGSDPVAVAKVIERALTDRKPAPRYLSGMDAHAALLLRPLVHDRLFDLLIRTFFGLHRKKERAENAAARRALEFAFGAFFGVAGLALLLKNRKS